MKDAITKAIEGGYKLPIIHSNLEVCSSDREFWQCLGKALGWENMPSGDIWQNKPRWFYTWHSFIDHLAEGKDVDDFFKSLIK